MKLPTLKEDGWQLQSIEEHAQEYGGTFEALPIEQRASLKVGQVVKLAFRILVEDEAGHEQEVLERMWVKVQGTDRGMFLGALDNNAQYAEHMVAGVEVPFQPEHVIQVWPNER